MIEIELSEARKFIIPLINSLNTVMKNYFIIGATARDLLFDELNGIAAPIATKDVDVAIMVETWADFDAIESEDHDYEFPSEAGRVFSVVGFMEVSETCLTVLLDQTEEVRVASPAGITLTKLISWNDRPAEREQDIQDIFFMMYHYADFLGIDTAYNDFPKLFEQDDFEWDTASAKMLGIRVGELGAQSEIIRHKVRMILGNQIRDRFDSPFMNASGSNFYLDEERAFRGLKSFNSGFESVT